VANVIPEWLKSIWRDPVWSKVIAQGIIRAVTIIAGGLAAASWLIFHYRGVLLNALPVPLWLLLLLVISLIGLALGLAYALLWRKRGEPRLFSSLQVEAFQLAKELRGFMQELGPRPTVHDKSAFENTPDGVEKHLNAVMALDRPRDLKLQNAYAAQFAGRVKSIRFRFGEAGLDECYRLDGWIDWIVSEADVQRCARTLDELAISLNSISEARFTRKQVDEMTADELRARLETEPGFADLVAYYRSERR
jgi:hypothetical protein